MAEARAIKFGT